MNHRKIVVHAEWDDEAGVWVATSRDIDGLCVEAETMEALRGKVLGAINDLLELNDDHWPPEIPVQIMAEQLSRIANPRR